MNESEKIKAIASRLLEQAQAGCTYCPENNARYGEDCTNQACRLARDIREAREAGLGI